MKKLQDWEIRLLVSTMEMVCKTLPELGPHDRDKLAAKIYGVMRRTLKPFYDARERLG
jgi:hypothetical protein